MGKIDNEKVVSDDKLDKLISQALKNRLAEFLENEQKEINYDENDESNLNYRTRKFSFTKNYRFEVQDENGDVVWKITEEEWKQHIIDLINGLGVKKAWYIFHDKCKKSNGQKKELHVHGFLEFEHAVSRNAAINKLKMTKYGNNKTIHYWISKTRRQFDWIRYLTHTSNKSMNDKKRRYEISDLVLIENGKIVNDYEKKLEEYTIDIVGNEEKEQVNKNKMLKDLLEHTLQKALRFELMTFVEVVEDMENSSDGVLSESDIRLFTANSRIKNYIETVLEQALEHRIEQRKRGTLKEISKNCYFSGFGSSGKTRAAKEISRIILGMEKISSSSIHQTATQKQGGNVFDYADGYKGQHIIIFDELDANSLGFTEFANVFDENNTPTVQSRYKNRTLIHKYAFVTKSTNFDKWVDTLARKSSAYKEETMNQIRQIKRRFSFVLECETNGITVLKRVINGYNSDGGKNFEFEKVGFFELGEKWPENDELTEQAESGLNAIARLIQE